ncbi:MAG: ABC transporter substrate-binding protein [Pseudomonadota bacterium]
MPRSTINLLTTGLLVAMLALLGGGRATAQERLEVAYIPILPMAQLFVMQGEGWTEEAGLDLELTRFSSGPAIVQAIASGRFDVMYFGIGPAMVARANGVPIKVVAANVVEQIALVARGRFAEIMRDAESPAAGVRAFAEETGREPAIASLPRGSVPDTVLRYWLTEVAGIDPEDVDIKGMGADKVQQAMLARSVDAASILEPIVTIIQSRLDDAHVVAAGGEMLPDQPGAVVAVREDLVAERPEVVAKLVALHQRATELLNTEPRRAARHVHTAIGQGLIPLQTIEDALGSSYGRFVADPRTIVAATATMHDFARELGTLPRPVPLADLFEPRFYEAATAVR